MYILEYGSRTQRLDVSVSNLSNRNDEEDQLRVSEGNAGTPFEMFSSISVDPIRCSGNNFQAKF